MIRVAIVDDETLVRQGLRSLLDHTADMEVVGEAADAGEALRVIDATRPDVALVDVRLRGSTGIDVLGDVQRSRCPTGIIIVTTFDDAGAALAAMRAGARGFLLKDVSLEQLAHAIRVVAAGGSLIQPTVTDCVLQHLGHASLAFSCAEHPDALTPREVAILRLLAGGYSNGEIAEALQIALGTVKNHISSILSKLGVRDRTRAVLQALKSGYI
jgi:DNA-binding NarL/FixJ family response regulator